MLIFSSLSIMHDAIRRKSATHPRSVITLILEVNLSSALNPSVSRTDVSVRPM